MIWSIFQVIGRQGITLIMFSLLALLLKPADFGTLAMAMTWIAFVKLFSEMGFGAALIQRQDVNSSHFSTIFITNIVVGVFLTIIGIILSFPCALFFKNPDVQPIVAVLSLNFLVNSFSWTQQAIAQKELRFRHLAIRDISAALIGGIAGIILALLGFGIWSLVVQSLVTNIIATLLIWFLSKWRPVLKEFSFKYIKQLWPYSSKIFAFIIFKYFAQNTDKLIIGYFLGNITLGLYIFAFRIVVYPISMVVGAIGNYLFPKFSRMQNDLKTINKSYLYVVKAINSVVAPLMVIVAFLSPFLVQLIWGQKWLPAVPLMQILVVVAIAQSLISPVGQLMKALNRPGWLIYWSVFFGLIVSILIWVGIHYGLAGAVGGLALAHIFAIPIIFFISIRLIHIKLGDILNALFPSLLSTLLMGLLTWFVFHSEILIADLRVVIGLFLGVALYLISLMWLDKPFLANIFSRLVKT